MFNRPLAPWLRNALIGTASILAITALTALVQQKPSPQQTPSQIAFGPEIKINTHFGVPARIILPKNVPTRAKTLSSAFAVTQRRVDLALPGQQSWEPSIMVTRADNKNAAGDEVVALWMDGRATTALSDLRIGITRSVDGGNHWATFATWR